MLNVLTWLENEKWRYVFAALVMLLLHLPLALLQVNSVKKPASELSMHLPEVLSLPPSNSSGLPRFVKELYEWSEIADPAKMLQGDLEGGFSRHANPSIAYEQPSLPQWSLPELRLPPSQELESELAVDSDSLADMLQANWQENSAFFLPPLPKAESPEGVFWRLEGRRGLIQNIEMPPEYEKLLQDPEELAQLRDSSLLELSRLPGQQLFRVRVKRSSGSRRLDQLAAQALRLHLLKKQAQAREQSLPDLDLRRSLLLEVDWRP